MGSTGFEPRLVAEPSPLPVSNDAARRRPSNEASTRLATRRLDLAAAIQRVKVTQRLTSQHASSSQQVKGTVQRNHMAGSVLHLMTHTTSEEAAGKSAAYAAAAHTQSQAEQWRLSGGHDAGVMSLSAAARKRLSSVRAPRRRTSLRRCSRDSATAAVIAQSCSIGGKDDGSSGLVYAVLDELLALTAGNDAAPLEAGLRQHAEVIRKCRGAVGETVLHLCFLFGSAAHKVLATHLVKEFGVDLVDAQYVGPEYRGEVAMHIALVNKVNLDPDPDPDPDPDH